MPKGICRVELGVLGMFPLAMGRGGRVEWRR